MGEIRLFHEQSGHVIAIDERPFSNENELKGLFEANLEMLTDIEFVSTEFPFDVWRGRRIDTLGLDKDGRPVIIEYKKDKNDNIIKQGLEYLYYLLHDEDNVLRCLRQSMGRNYRSDINVREAWLLCVAKEFTHQDLICAKFCERRVELLQYERFDGYLVVHYRPEILLPRQNREQSGTRETSGAEFALDFPQEQRRRLIQEFAPEPPAPPKLMHESDRAEPLGARLDITVAAHEFSEYPYMEFLRSDFERLALFTMLREYMEGLGVEVQTYARKTYIGFGCLEGNRRRRLAIMRVYKREEGLHVQVDVSKEIVEQAVSEHPDIMYRAHERVDSGFYYENLAIEIRSLADLDKAKSYLRHGYNKMLTVLARS